MATRQVGDETLSPRAHDLVRSAYQVIARQGSHCHQRPRTLLGAGR
ncbi:MAG TPA: hypothetical protein VLA80_03985 [Actinomycetota bacterium]|nr:hypothetical protein [Actinomycetota bacterium]